jgi:hypothetical protein
VFYTWAILFLMNILYLYITIKNQSNGKKARGYHWKIQIPGGIRRPQ